MIKIVSAHQPSFLPWVGLIHKLMLADEFILMDLAKFRKREYMHRNFIEINGKKNYLGLKLNDKSDFLTCNKVFISDFHKDNLLQIKKKIINTYRNFKFFEDLNRFLNECFSLERNDLISICLNQLDFFNSILKINIKIIKESSIIKLDELNKINNPSERLLLHALKTKADIYVTGINSLNYLDKSIFIRNKILNYIQNFDYTFFKIYQKTEGQLSVIHQIATIGFSKLKEIILKTQENKENLKKLYDRS